MRPPAPDAPGAAPRVPSAFSRRLLRVFLFGAVAAVALVLVGRAATVLLLLFAGVLFAIFLNGCARWLTRTVRLPYWLGLLLVVLLLLALAGGSTAWLGSRLAGQIAGLLDQVPAAARALIGAGRLHRWSRELLGEGGGQGLLRDAETVLATARGLVRISGTILGGAAVFLFLGVYVAAQPAVYRRGLLRLVPLPARPRAEEVVSATVVSLRRWLFGRVVAMCFVGLGVTLGLWLIGIQAALALGLLAGLLTFVEYIGAIVSVVPPLLIGATHGWSTVFWILVLFGAAHAVEGYLLTPLLARRTVRFPPGLTLAVQLLFGLFFGAPGLMLATPTSVVVARLVEMLYIEDVLHDRPAGSRA